ASRVRTFVAQLDDVLYGCWRLGEQVVVLWTAESSSISLLHFPHFALAEYVCGVRPIAGESDPGAFIDRLVSGPKHASVEKFAAIAAKLGVAPVRFELRFDPVRDLGAELVESLLRRYSVSLFRNRAVVLLDIVAFSTYTPIDRKSTRLNSSHVTISYAVLCFKKKNE